MRISDQMLSLTAAKSGISLQKNSLLDIMNKKSASANDWFPSAGGANRADSIFQMQNAKKDRKLFAAAESLSGYAEKLAEEGEGSLFAEAEATGDSSKLAAGIINMADAYNQTVRQLKQSDSTLNKFYLQELKSYVSENKKALEAAGVTVNKDGTLSVKEDALNAAGVDVLKEAFAGKTGFSEKVGFVSGRVADNAAAAQAGLLGTYGRGGKEIAGMYSQNMHNFWG